MKEHPILFSSPMIRAILAGRKSQTRRIAKGITEETCYVGLEGHDGFVPVRDDGKETPILCPYGSVGDRLWVRETSAVYAAVYSECGIVYRADHATGDLSKGDGGYNFHQFSDDPEQADKDRKWAAKHSGSEKWIPSIYMPRFASRITLEITGVRVERLQEITEADVMAEGCRADEDPYWRPSYHDPDSGGNPSARLSYEFLWEEINGVGSWAKNPFVWCVSFKRV